MVEHMLSDEKFDELFEKALACKSEEEAFAIIQRLRPYLADNRVDTQASSTKDLTERDGI